jgi:hypothetical protein
VSRKSLSLITTLAGSAILSAAACNMGDAGSPAGPAVADAAAPGVQFQAEPPSVYVAKVKNILVGDAPTDAEVKAVEADPTQLKGLITGWMTSAQYSADYQRKMLRFFQLAFQQTQVVITDFDDQAFPVTADANSSTQGLLVQNAQESFARTMLAMTQSGQSMQGAATTTSFMMTPALMELYAFFDWWQVDDAGTVTDTFKKAYPTVTLTAEKSQGPIPIADSLNPASPNYLTFYDADLGNAALTAVGCGQDPISYPASGYTLHYLLYGTLVGRTVPVTALTPTGKCNQYGGTAAAPQITGTDFTDWKMITIRPPNAGESPTAFWDLATLRTTDTLVLSVPRVGFFSTAAFFANWQTNTSNTMRVTVNQALIVATGASVDGNDTTVPPSTPGLDAEHAAPGTACYGCHQLLDPTRSILSATYSWNYHTQTDTTLTPVKGLFAFEGVINTQMNTVADFGNQLATHPLFASAWVQKLCYYANSTACETTDPEFKRVVGVFTSSGYNWNTLVAELLSSPLTTYATPTQTAEDVGDVTAVSRRDHLCAALNVRLGFADVCGLDLFTVQAQQTTIPEIVSGLPSDGYGRGSVAPVLPNQPTLFYRAGTENICEAVAALTIDTPTAKQEAGVKQWSSAQSTAAINDFVNIVMALPPSDPRAAQATSLLTAHFMAATQSGATPTAALQSTFVAACLAPSAVSIGL